MPNPPPSDASFVSRQNATGARYAEAAVRSAAESGHQPIEPRDDVKENPRLVPGAGGHKADPNNNGASQAHAAFY